MLVSLSLAASTLIPNAESRKPALNTVTEEIRGLDSIFSNPEFLINTMTLSIDKISI